MPAQQRAAIKVLHKAHASANDDSLSDGAETGRATEEAQHSSECQRWPQATIELDSLKQRLVQVKQSCAAERKRLTDELRLERAGRQRAEELLIKQSKELEGTIAARNRLEDAFSRSMAELRYLRLEYAQAEDTIQHLLRDILSLKAELASRDSIERTSSPAGAAEGGSLGSRHGKASNGGGAEKDSCSVSLAVKAMQDHSSTLLNGKRFSRNKLIAELQQLRQAKVAAESDRDKLMLQLGTLAAEKERAEESQEMISRQTEKLLDDRQKLLTDLGGKEDAVRSLTAGLDHLQHQLELVLADRQLLSEQLGVGAADAQHLEALAAAMADEQLAAWDEFADDEQRQLQQHQEGEGEWLGSKTPETQQSQAQTAP